MAFQFDMMPGTIIKWDQENLIYWVVNHNNQPRAIITYDDDIAIDRIYYLIQIESEYSVINGRDIYRNTGELYRGFDFAIARELALQLVED